MIFSILIGLWLVLGLIAYIRFIVYCKEYKGIIKKDEWVKIYSSAILIILGGIVSFILFVVMGSKSDTK